MINIKKFDELISFAAALVAELKKDGIKLGLVRQPKEGYVVLTQVKGDDLDVIYKTVWLSVNHCCTIAVTGTLFDYDIIISLGKEKVKKKKGGKNV